MLILDRIQSTADYTQGILYNNDGLLCYTLELADKGNQRNISRIPAGSYPCQKIYSAKHGHCIAVRNVPDRTAILIHAGNLPKDTQGCILVGLDIQQDTLAESKSAMRRILLSVPFNFILSIR